MRMVGLTTFGFSIFDENNQRVDLNDINGRKFIDILENFVKTDLGNFSNIEKDERVFSFVVSERGDIKNENDQFKYRALYGKLKTGEYGVETELVDHNTGSVSYIRKENEADVLPFGFAVFIPAGKVNHAVMVLQSLGIYSMKMILHKQLDRCVKSIDARYSFTMGVIVPRVVLERYLTNGALKAVRIIKYEIPQDTAERFGVNYNVNESYEEIIIRNPIGFLQNKRREIEEWKNGTRRYDQVVQIEDFEYDDLKLDFKMGRNMKTISLKNIDNLQMKEDVTKEVDLDGGNPTFVTLKEVMKERGEFYLYAEGLLVE